MPDVQTTKPLLPDRIIDTGRKCTPVSSIQIFHSDGRISNHPDPSVGVTWDHQNLSITFDPDTLPALREIVARLEVAVVSQQPMPAMSDADEDGA